MLEELYNEAITNGRLMDYYRCTNLLCNTLTYFPIYPGDPTNPVCKPCGSPLRLLYAAEPRWLCDKD